MDSDQGTAHASGGYANPAYARALAHIGSACELFASGGWCLIQPIPGTPWQDAVGPYPFLMCRQWSGLPEDLHRLADAAITATFVTDPLAEVPIELLERSFPDLCRRYKEHVVVDLAASSSAAWSPHHRRNVARGLRETDVTFLEDPLSGLDDWIDLYGLLICRHGITGPAAFSAASFRLQFTIDGIVVVRASRRDETVGMTIWFVDGDRAYYHLGVVSDRGREHRAMFAMFAAAFESLHLRGATRLCLGAGAGTHAASAGLERFKRGWSTHTLPAYLCGRVLNREAHDAACSMGSGTTDASYFPPYRRP